MNRPSSGAASNTKSPPRQRGRVEAAPALPPPADAFKKPHAEGALRLAGVTVRMNRDSLDAQNFPRVGLLARFQVDKRSKTLGSSLNYWKWQGDAGDSTSPSDLRFDMPAPGEARQWIVGPFLFSSSILRRSSP